jgi:hypothetical protein
MRIQKFAATIFLTAAIGTQGCSPDATPLEHDDVAFDEYGEEEDPLIADSSVVSSSVLGWNMDFIYAGGFAFANKIKMARRWISCTTNTWDDGRPLALDLYGYPTSLLAGQQATTLLKVHGGGQYVIRWSGTGTLDVRDHLGIVSQSANKVVINTAPNMQIQLRITSVPVTAIDVRKAGVPSTAFWDPVFEQRLLGAKVIRFMQWGMTNGDNGSVARTWTERSKPTYFTQNQQHGVSYEHMIKLSNRLGADAWINIPHLADDAHVRNLALLLRARLRTDLKVYVEWSNEVWNDSFPQAQYARQQGLAAGLGNGDGHVARLQYQARRTRQVFQIFEQVFAGQMQRVVRVVAGQCGNSWNDGIMMPFENLSAHADALAVAPYFGHNAGRQANAGNVRSGGVNWVMNYLTQTALPGLITEIQDSASSAQRWGVPLIAYEGGQHVVAEPSLQNDASITSVLEAAQRDSRMYTLYDNLLDAWTARGGELFVHYTYTGAWNKWGYWGALENNDSPTTSNGAHKYRAVLDWAALQP